MLTTKHTPAADGRALLWSVEELSSMVREMISHNSTKAGYALRQVPGHDRVPLQSGALQPRRIAKVSNAHAHAHAPRPDDLCHPYKVGDC